MQSVRLIAFDLDGTLIDSAAGIVATITAVLAEFGQPLPAPDAIMALIGLPLRHFWATFAPVDPQRWEAYTERYRAIYREAAIPAMRPFPGVPALLESLASAGFALSIASSKITPVSTLILERLGLLGYFGLVMGDDSVSQPKPHPEMLERTLAHFSLSPTAALMVGDTTHDIALAHAAGVPVVAVASGTQASSLLEAAQPLAVLNELAELPPLLATLAPTSSTIKAIPVALPRSPKDAAI